jgi:hypothetical protein
MSSNTPAYIRVVNSQVLKRSILLDKIDRTSGQFVTDLTYAQTAKQKVYIPYANPLDPTVAGYLDLIPTDEVLLQANQPKGVIFQLGEKGYISYFSHSGVLSKTPVISGAVHTAAKTGSHGQFANSIGASAVFTDATLGGFANIDIGSYLTVATSSVAANEGIYEITAATPVNAVTVAFSTAAVDTAADTWSTPGGVQIVGTTFLSITPDVTKVIVTNPTGTSQTVLATMLSTTELFVPNSSVIGGPIVATWKVQVHANSKLSNVFTVT